MLASDFVSKYDVTADVKFVDTRRSDGWDHTLWHVALTAYGKTVTTDFCAGLAYTNIEIEDVIDSLSLDAQCGEMSFEEYAGEFGYNPDSRKAYATWEACRDMRTCLYGRCRSEEMWSDLLSAHN